MTQQIAAVPAGPDSQPAPDRVRPFAWPVFFLVFRWALVAYLVIAGLLGFVFVRDHTPGATLAVLVATLLVFAVDVPLILAFTVARYADPGPATADPRTR